MLCTQLGVDNMTIMAQKIGMYGKIKQTPKKGPEKETIHSGHFMVSDFEAEAQDDGDELAVPLPEEVGSKAVISSIGTIAQISDRQFLRQKQPLSIEPTLSKLFQCMSLAYRQKLTSPKWNPFKGIRLRWKDKIRLNNVIWRCWHMQFIGKKNSLVCQFASPLDVDTHNKPEAVVLEGKYWKRKLSAVTAEYKKWRMYYRNQLLGCHPKEGLDMLAELDCVDWNFPNKPSNSTGDDDYMEIISDTLFSTISLNQPFAFPDTREIARGAGIADFIQPSLVQLQPNLDDFMDTLEPLQDLIQSKLAPVPEETTAGLVQSVSGPYPVALVCSQKNFVQQMPYTPFTNNTWYVPSYTPPNTPELPTPNFTTQPQTSNNTKSSILHVNNRNMVEKQLLPRQEEMFAVPKIKPKSRSQSGQCSSMTRKDSGIASNMPSMAPPSDSILQPHPSSHHSSALLAQLLTSNTSAPYSCDTNQGSISNQVPSIMDNRVDSPYGTTVFRTLDNSLLYQSPSDLTKSQGQFGLTSECKRNAAMLPQSPLAPESPSTTLIISPNPTPIPNLSFVNSSNPSPESPASDTLCYSPQNVASPTSACTSPSSVKCGSGSSYKEHRRVCHINAEQKRRCNIKNGFDTLYSLIPQLNQNPNTKMSKAAMLQKGADYIRQLRNERNQLKQEIETLKQQIDSLSSSISNCQSMLPVTGAPVSKQRNTKMRDMFQQYVRQRTHEDWKFWILSLICEPLLMTFSDNVSTASLDELYSTTMQWVDQHCSLIDLRPIVLNSLRHLSTTTEVLADPARLPIEAKAAVDKKVLKK